MLAFYDLCSFFQLLCSMLYNDNKTWLYVCVFTVECARQTGKVGGADVRKIQCASNVPLQKCCALSVSLKSFFFFFFFFFSSLNIVIVYHTWFLASMLCISFIDKMRFCYKTVSMLIWVRLYPIEIKFLCLWIFCCTQISLIRMNTLSPYESIFLNVIDIECGHGFLQSLFFFLTQLISSGDKTKS